MVKDVVVALLTTTINRYSELKFRGNLMSKEMVIKDLTGVLDYVEDISEKDNHHIRVVLNNSKEVETLKKRIRELEEICQDNNEVIKTQFIKIQKLETENKKLKSRVGTLYKLESVEGIK